MPLQKSLKNQISRVALKDYEKFEGYVLHGGYIIFHDFNPDDPKAAAVNEAVKTIIERTKKQPEVFEQLAIFPNSRSLWRQFLTALRW